MNTKLIILFSMFSLGLLSCNNTDQKEHNETDKHAHGETVKHWSYEGETAPEHWIEIEKNSDCDGKHQSPINIIHIDTDSIPLNDDLKFDYSASTLLKDVINNGHTILFDFDAGDYINYKDEKYTLKQIHFHEPSEHKINGIIYPIEMHLVHLSESGKITVIGILGKEGEESQLFEFLESYLPVKNGAKKEVNKEVDLNDLLLDDKSYYSYGGSFTTPPCTEGINWIVYKDPIVLSLEEVLKLRDNMPINNYRNEQPVNDRVVNFNH